MNQSILWDGSQQTLTVEDAEMVAAAQKNPAEFRQLYTKWLNPVYRYFYFRLGNVKDAEDLTSQVFLKVFEDLPRYRNQGCFSAWLFTIAHARAVDYFRKTKKIETLDAIELSSSDPDLLSHTIQQEELENMLRLLHNLDEDEQELIRLRFVAELGYREIGEILHRSEEAIRKSISRLLDRLQKLMEVKHD